jgi:hypothetical protein
MWNTKDSLSLHFRIVISFSWNIFFLFPKMRDQWNRKSDTRRKFSEYFDIIFPSIRKAVIFFRNSKNRVAWQSFVHKYFLLRKTNDNFPPPISYFWQKEGVKESFFELSYNHIKEISLTHIFHLSPKRYFTVIETYEHDKRTHIYAIMIFTRDISYFSYRTPFTMLKHLTSFNHHH